jgi:hypothetical protein
MGEISNGVHPDNPDAQPVYKPAVHFDDSGLWVEFDHALKATPEQISKLEITSPMTAFLIHPDRELYLGLAYVPRPVLTEVARGLRSYVDSEEFSDEQRVQIRVGVIRLERYLSTGER